MQRIILLALISVSCAKASTVVQSSFTCTVYDGATLLSSTVGNSCIAPDGVTLVTQGVGNSNYTTGNPPVFAVADAAGGLFTASSGFSGIEQGLPSGTGLVGPYEFDVSATVSLTEWFELLGGSGTGYVEANVFGIGPGADACFLCRASASILGGINDIGGGCSDQGCRNFLFGPFTFGQPFQVTLTASASAYYPEAASDQGGSGDLQEIDILGVVDSSGNPIAGAFLAPVSEPTMWPAVVAGLFALFSTSMSRVRHRSTCCPGPRYRVCR